MPAARQISAFFGIDGVLAQYGGTRGWTFQIAGVFEEFDIAALNVDISNLMSFIGPFTHTFIDTSANTWPNVVFDGEFQSDPMGPRPTDVGWCRAYSLTLHGLSS